MIVEAMNRTIQLAAPNVSEHDGLEYTDKVLTLIAPPMEPGVSTATLTGFADIIEAMTLADCFLLVQSPVQVICFNIKADDYGRRQLWVSAQHDGPQFKFGTFLTPEEFAIGLRSKFVVSDSVVDDLDYVLKMAANVGAGAVATAEDDGMSQKVTVTRGIALKGTEVLKPIVSLTPWRTFPEVIQPTSRFVFRARGNGDGQVPSLGLFEADGGQWKIDAANAIAAWLKNNRATFDLVTVR
jgi:hypothetical protein